MSVKVSHFCLIFPVIFFIHFCTAREVIEPAPVPVAIATEKDSCSEVDSDGSWQALFDIYRISGPDFTDYAYKRDRTYKYILEERWQDWLTNLTIGYLTTVTRHTAVLKECNLQVEVRTRDEIQKQIDDAMALHLKNKRSSREMKEQPIFIMQDGTSKQGRLVGFDQESFLIEVETSEESSDTDEESDKKPSSESKTGDIIKLKNGKSMKGNVINQTADSITIRTTDNKTEKVSKSEINQVKFNVSLAEEEIKTERIRLERTKVSRIKLP